MKKKIFALVLVFSMILGALPGIALGDIDDSNAKPAGEVEDITNKPKNKEIDLKTIKDKIGENLGILKDLDITGIAGSDEEKIEVKIMLCRVNKSNELIDENHNVVDVHYSNSDDKNHAKAKIAVDSEAFVKNVEIVTNDIFSKIKLENHEYVDAQPSSIKIDTEGIIIYGYYLPVVIPVPSSDSANYEDYHKVKLLPGKNGVFKDGKKEITFCVLDGKKILENNIPEIVPNLNYEFEKWDKVITKAISEDITFTAQYKLKDIIEGTDPKDEAREGYKRVEFFADDAVKADPAADAVKGKLKSKIEGSPNQEVKYLYYDVKEGKKYSDLPVPEIVANEGYEAAEALWSPAIPEDTKDIDAAKYTAQYTTKAAAIEGTNPQDVVAEGCKRVEFYVESKIMGNPEAESSKGYLKSAKPGSKNTEVKYLYYDIKEDATFADVPVPEIVAKEGYEVDTKKWTTEFPEGTVKIKESQFIAKINDKHVIGPMNPKDENLPGVPKDYITLTFVADKNGKIKGDVTLFYVDTKVERVLGDIEKPQVEADEGYEFWDWDKKDDVKLDKDLEVKALFNKIGVPRNKVRLFGQDRIATAIKISEEKFQKADTVLIARHDVFADALVAGPLAYAFDAPILLSRPNELPRNVIAEIERLGAKKIILVGGEGSLDENVEKEAKKIDEVAERLSGPTRYDTAVEVALRLKEIVKKDNKIAVIATGENYPDALSVGPFAATESMPILLVKKNEVPDSVGVALNRLGIEEIYISGGENSVSDKLEKKLPKLLERFKGDDRYGTAVDIASKTNPSALNKYLASGEVFADALVAGPVAAMDDAPILLTNKYRISEELKELLKESKTDIMTIVGGTNTIIDNIIK